MNFEVTHLFRFYEVSLGFTEAPPIFALARRWEESDTAKVVTREQPCSELLQKTNGCRHAGYVHFYLQSVAEDDTGVNFHLHPVIYSHDELKNKSCSSSKERLVG